MYHRFTSHFPESKAFGMCLFFLTHITSIRFSIFDFGVLDSVGVYLSWLGYGCQQHPREQDAYITLMKS